MRAKTIKKQVGLIALIILVVNVFSFFYYVRIDFTSDNRFTLSGLSTTVINSINDPMKITVYLEGDLKGEFKRLQRETTFLLEELHIENRRIIYEFVDPLDGNKDAQQVANMFYQSGMMPENINEKKNGKLTKTTVFPWAVIQYRGKEEKVHLLNKQMNVGVEEMVNSSIQNLEYVFTNAITKLSRERAKKIAVLRSKGELNDRQLTDFLKKVSEYYLIAPFSLDSVASKPQIVYDELLKFDAIISPKPREKFTDEEVYVLDQYIMNGGRALWMIDNVAIEKDSLKGTGSAIAMPRDLNLLNLFFKYGVRINYELINDVYSAPIYLSTDSNENTQLNPYPWFYEPLVQPQIDHPIVTNINAVKFEFANSIDTLKNGIRKTVLLQSSESSRAEGTPREISLDIINSRPTPDMYPEGNYPMAVLLEGEFTSVYKDRITPVELNKHSDKSIFTMQVVVADGDIAKNEIQRGKPLALGFDRFTGDTYGNKDFLINTLNYMLGDEELLELRSRIINIATLDDAKVEANRWFYQILNIVVTTSIIIFIGLAFSWYRKRRMR